MPLFSKTVGNGDCEDKIGSLPDVILSDIVSMLSTKEAVATTVLSKRWNHVFSGVTCFHFDASPLLKTSNYECSSSTRFTNFFKFVDSALNASQSNIYTFKLRFSTQECGCSSRPGDECPKLDPDFASLSKWIRFPLTRSVREYDVCANVRLLGKLPCSDIFCCPTVEVLKLESNLSLELPYSVRLPIVKVLHLRLTSTNWPSDYLSILVSSCPSLEDLVLNCSYIFGDSLVISSPWLRKCVIITNASQEFNLGHFVMEAPHLEYLDYRMAHAALDYTISNMNALVEANLGFKCCHEVNFDTTLLRFLKSCCHVSSLSLIDQSAEELMRCDSLKHKLPVFHNLRHLQLGLCCSVDLDSGLLDLLECLPSLESLGLYIDEDVIGEDGFYFPDEPGFMPWTTEQRVPSCLKLHLRSITIEFDFQPPHLKLPVIGYFLENATLLEEMVIKFHSKYVRWKWRLIDRLLWLQNQQRSSVVCTFRAVIV